MLGTPSATTEAAFRFGKLGFDLVEKRGPLRFKARVYFCFAQPDQFTGPNTCAAASSWQRRAVRGGRRRPATSDRVLHAQRPDHAAARGRRSAREVQREAEEALAFARKAKFGLVVDTVTAQLRLIQTLRGVTGRFSSFDDDDFDEASSSGTCEGDPRLAIAVGWYWIRKLQARFFARDHGAAARGRGEGADPAVDGAVVPRGRRVPLLRRARARGGARRRAGPRSGRGHLRALAGHHRQTADRGRRHCPENFAHRAALLAAERARLRGDGDEALRACTSRRSARRATTASSTTRRSPTRRRRGSTAARARADRRRLPARGARPLPALGRRRQGARPASGITRGSSSPGRRGQRRPSRCPPSSSTCSRWSRRRRPSRV